MRKKILVLNFFELFNPNTSKVLNRLWKIYDNLSKWFDISFLSPTNFPSDKINLRILEHNPHFKEYLINREQKFFIKQYHKIFEENVSQDIGGLYSSRSSNFPTNYHKIYSDLYPEHDIIIHECPFMADFDLFLGIDDKPRILSTLSDEFQNAYYNYKGANRVKYLNHIFKIEEKLCRYSKKIIITANYYRQNFILRYQINKDKIILIPYCPNYIQTKKIFNERKKKKNNNKLNLLYLGNPYSSGSLKTFNFINEKLAKERKDITFNVIGNFKSSEISKNINIFPEITNEEKERLSIEASVAFVLSEESILEYLSSGIPSIAYFETIEGINLEHNKILFPHYELNDLAILIKKAEKITWEDCEATSNEVIKKYEWSELSKEIKNTLELL